MNGLLKTLETTAVFTLLGLLVFSLVFWIVVRISPVSVRKEIEDDQNVALAILVGSVIIGLALIISAAIHS